VLDNLIDETVSSELGQWTYQSVTHKEMNNACLSAGVNGDYVITGNWLKSQSTVGLAITLRYQNHK